MATDKEIEAEINKNYKVFEGQLPDLMNSQPGKFALMRNKKIMQFFDSAGDAMIYAEAQYSDGLYSIQKITVRTTDLGYFSHAVHLRPV